MPLQLGDPKPLAVTVANAAGVVGDPTAITLTVEKPDGTVDTVSTTHDGPGLYSAVYTPASAGHYVARWVATGTNASVFEESFDVDPAYASVGIVDLASVKTHLGKTTTTDDDELLAVITAATAIVESIVGPVIRRTVTDVISGGSRSQVLLSTVPVLSVTSIATSSYGQAVASYVTADLTVDTAAGLVRVTDGTWLTGDATVVYVAGRTQVPPNVRWATLELVRHLWSSQRGAATFRPSFAGGGAEEDLVAVESGYLIPNRVMEALRPQALAPSVA